MGASKTRYQLVFLFLILYILSKMMGAIIVIVKTMKNAKFLQFQEFLVVLRKVQKII